MSSSHEEPRSHAREQDLDNYFITLLFLFGAIGFVVRRTMERDLVTPLRDKVETWSGTCSLICSIDPRIACFVGLIFVGLAWASSQDTRTACIAHFARNRQVCGSGPVRNRTWVSTGASAPSPSNTNCLTMDRSPSLLPANKTQQRLVLVRRGDERPRHARYLAGRRPHHAAAPASQNAASSAIRRGSIARPATRRQAIVSVFASPRGHASCRRSS